MIERFTHLKLYAGVILLIGLVSSTIVYAQIEGAPRGVLPIASNGDFEVSGIEVDIVGVNAFEARSKGWQIAQRKAWQKLWARTRGGTGGGLSDNSLDSMVSSIVIEEEQIGPKRYVAKLGVIFDRARAGQILGVKGIKRRSAPLLILPITISGGAPTLYERRTEWQKAWARYKTSDSSIDYVRPTGSGAESLLLNAGQISRRSRSWWRVILDEFGAADIVSATVRFQRSYPGGPISAHYTARYGPDNVFIGRFSLRVTNKNGIPAMMDMAVKRMDGLFENALSAGRLRLDRSLILEDPELLEEAEAIADAEDKEEMAAVETARSNNAEEASNEQAGVVGEAAARPAIAQTFSIQFATPDVGAVDAGEGAVRAISGVKSASTTSLALGGTSVMRVTYAGDAAALRAALSASGWRVGGAGNTLTISR